MSGTKSYRLVVAWPMLDEVNGGTLGRSFAYLLAGAPTDLDGDGSPSAAADADGQYSPYDCDDRDPMAFPLAWYPDTDGDGYGEIEAAVMACTSPGGHVADGSDCDDTDAATRPGAAEVCNGLDDDCVGGLDDSGACDSIDLQVTAIHPAQVATLSASNLLPGETVYFVGSLGPVGAGPCLAPLGGRCLSLGAPVQLVGTGVADLDGRASIDQPVPPWAAVGSVLTFQAAVARGAGGADSALSAPVQRSVQP